MKIYFYAPNRIEPWDYRNVFDIGIGGSETSHVEMALRLKARGHEVYSYTDLPNDCPDKEFGGVHWRHLDEATFNNDGTWIVYRDPSFGKTHPELTSWLICQDVFYPNWSSEGFKYIFGLCPRHVADILARDQACKDKLLMTSNGINVEEIEKLGQYSHERNLKRLVWTSSPDRGLKELLDIFEKAVDIDSELTLDIYYGMDNINKICGGDQQKLPWKDSWDQSYRSFKIPGVTWRGRIGQKQLRKEIYTSGMWCYPTWFCETSCISCMEAQACGAIPITNPIWATGYNVRHGVFIEGSPNEPLMILRYVQAIVRLANNPQLQARIRNEMMPESRARLSWERFVDQWESLLC